MTTQRFEEHTLATCFAAHRKLAEVAAILSQRLSKATEAGYLMHLGAGCMSIAAKEALASRDPHTTLSYWRECSLAERQIRLATYRALRARAIDSETYDEIFALAKEASRIREYERQHLRRRLLSHAII